MSWAIAQNGVTISTRRARSSHALWSEQAHAYQHRAVAFLLQQNAAALFLDPGLGKTSIVLDAFRRLKASGAALRMLVIAPLRVCQTVWRQEGQKWTEFRDLRFSLLHGPKKADRLRDDADVWLINPEGVAWLAEQYRGRTLPFDTVTVDELTKFKNQSAQRHKALRPRLRGVARRWGLTGTPAPNGLADLFGQFLLLDDGAALGRFVTHFRDQYFQADHNGFDYVLLPGAEKRIEARIAPYVLRMGAEDYMELPPLVDDVRELELDAKSRATYLKMKRDMLAELPEGVVTGANAAAAYSKLKQMANGAVYVTEDKKSVARLNDIKLEALDELVEELAGQQLLLAYEFNHDMHRLKEHYGDKLTVLESGMGETKTAAIVEAWNAGSIALLACHPASAAHGLNLQYSACGHVAWFSPIWDLELYQQFIRRIRRQGNDAQRIVNHIFCVKDSIDELALAALRDKDTTQGRLLASLNTEILRDAGTPAAREIAAKETRLNMTVAKLSRPSDAPRIVPKGWGAPKTAEPERTTQPFTPQPEVDVTAQRERIAAKLTGVEPLYHGNPADKEPDAGPSMADRARAAFSQPVREALNGGAPVELPDAGLTRAVEKAEAAVAAQPTVLVGKTEITRPTTRTRTRTTPAPETAPPWPWNGVTPELRWDVFKFVADKCDTPQEAIELAREIVEFLSGE